MVTIVTVIRDEWNGALARTLVFHKFPKFQIRKIKKDLHSLFVLIRQTLSLYFFSSKITYLINQVQQSINSTKILPFAIMLAIEKNNFIFVRYSFFNHWMRLHTAAGYYLEVVPFWLRSMLKKKYFNKRIPSF